MSVLSSLCAKDYLIVKHHTCFLQFLCGDLVRNQFQLTTTDQVDVKAKKPHPGF